MRKEVKEWMEKAEKDLKRAEFLLSVGDFEDCAFHAHQAAEKALKALYILKFKKLWKIHDLKQLSEAIGGSSEIVEMCKALNPHYLVTRYPLKVEYNKEKATEAFETTKKVLEWVRKKIEKK